MRYLCRCTQGPARTEKTNQHNVLPSVYPSANVFAEAHESGFYADSHGVRGALPDQLRVGEEALFHLRYRLPHRRFPDLLQWHQLYPVARLQGPDMRRGLVQSTMGNRRMETL